MLVVTFQRKGLEKVRDVVNNLAQGYLFQYHITKDSQYLIAYTTLAEAEIEDRGKKHAN